MDNNEVKEVVMFKTKDGKLFKDNKSAEYHKNELELTEFISSENSWMDSGDLEDLMEFLIRNKQKMCELISKL